ncbi:MAG: 16S rRNA (uracil(1498)-N(3))-methyltransferase [Verrucomicrobiota bacterium]
MNRFHAPSEHWDGDLVTLEDQEAHHCSRVFRHKPGDLVEAFDGVGTAAECEILDSTNREVRLQIIEKSAGTPLPVEITLIQAIPKAKTMDLIVQKAAEIGASTIVPVITERSVVKLNDEAKKQAKWQRTALESCKQCGRNWLPTVQPPANLADIISDEQSELRLVAALKDDSKKLREIATMQKERPKTLSIVIGPEGDFSVGELAELHLAQFKALSLGPTVLRSETAAIYALSIISHEFLEGTATFRARQQL